jgi:hypothetical protein
MMVTMPGLPMFGHGQIEGFAERYGMDFLSAKWDEKEDEVFIKQHEEIVFPLLAKRDCFSDPDNFYMFDFIDDENQINENVYVYLSYKDNEYFLILYNNSFKSVKGSIQQSVPVKRPTSTIRQYSIKEILLENYGKITSFSLIDFYDRKKPDAVTDDVFQEVIVFSLGPYESRVLMILLEAE